MAKKRRKITQGQWDIALAITKLEEDWLETIELLSQNQRAKLTLSDMAYKFTLELSLLESKFRGQRVK